MQPNKNEFVSNHIIYARNYLDKFHKTTHKYLLPSQANVLLAFDNENKSNDLSELTRRNYVLKLSRLAKLIPKPFAEMTKEDIMNAINKITINLAPYTSQGTKTVIKRFFKFVHKTDDYPNMVKWIKTSISKRHRNPIKKILTYEERTKLLKVCRNQRDRAILTFLDQTGCRAQELVLTKLKDISLGEKDAYLTVELGRGKTGRRRVVITEGISEIILWMNMHPHRQNPFAPLFNASINSDKCKTLGGTGLNTILTRLQNQAKMDKTIYPHLFRHTRATMAGKVDGWNESRMRVFFGWTRTSNMPAYYNHVNDDDVIELSLMDAGIKNKNENQNTEIKDKECPRCRKKNPFDSKFCNFCSLILDQESAAKNAEIVKITDDVMDISQEDDIKMPDAVKKYIDLKLKELVKTN